jgi:hypothetical protein
MQDGSGSPRRAPLVPLFNPVVPVYPVGGTPRGDGGKDQTQNHPGSVPPTQDMTRAGDNVFLVGLCVCGHVSA